VLLNLLAEKISGLFDGVLAKVATVAVEITTVAAAAAVVVVVLVGIWCCTDWYSCHCCCSYCNYPAARVNLIEKNC
jgi:hypothetical protein